MSMMAPGRVLPGVLDIDADFIGALNHDPGDLKLKRASRNFHHSGRRGSGFGCCRNFYYALLKEGALVGESLEASLGERCHFCQEWFQVGGFGGSGEDCTVSVGLHWETQDYFVAIPFGFQLHPVPQVVIAQV